ncbi:MAG: proline iminopeptidase-family hydrolase [Solirubrobacterales bacterium]
MVEEGFIEVPGGRVWYGVEGGGDGLPLLCLHGGPGFTHHSVASLADLADERRVILFDQLGCGKSDRPSDPAMWRTDRYVEEVAAIREALELDRFHMMGNSWGGMLTTRYVLDREPPVASLLLVGTPHDMPRYIAELPRLRPSLSDEVWKVIDYHEENGFTGCPEYVAAMVPFYKQHLCRLDPWPEELELSFAELGAESYEAMNGPSEFNITGVIKDWQVGEELDRIEVPVLVMAGRYDELSPEAQEDMARAFPNGEFVAFENGAHMPFFDDREAFMAAAREFLTRVEAG